MPRVSPRVVSDIIDFRGGWKPDYVEEALEPNDLRIAYNIDYDRRGGVRTRPGFTATDVADGLISFIHPFTLSDGTRMLVAAVDDGTAPPDDTVLERAIYLIEDDFTSTDTTRLISNFTIASDQPFKYDIPMTQLGDYLYVSGWYGGSNGNIRGEGDTIPTDWVYSTDFTINGDGDDTNWEFPLAKCLLSMHNRVWAGNVYHDGAAYYSRIRFSTLTNGTDQYGGNRWETNDYIDINDADGTMIQQIIGFQSSILVFKDRSIWVLGGTEPDNFTLFPVVQNVGTALGGSVATDGRVVFFLDDKKGVYVFDGVNVEPIDDGINQEILDHVEYMKSFNDNGDATYAASAVFDDRYILSIGNFDDTSWTRTFVFNIETRSWSEWDLQIRCMVEFNGKFYFGDDTGLFEFLDETVVDDDGTGFDWEFKTAPIPPTEDIDMRAYRLRRLDVLQEPGLGLFTLEGFAGGEATPSYVHSGYGGNDDEHFPGLAKLFDRISFKLSGTTDDLIGQPKRFQGLSAMFSARPQKRSWKLPDSQVSLSDFVADVTSGTSMSVPSSNTGDMLIHALFAGAGDADSGWTAISGWTEEADYPSYSSPQSITGAVIESREDDGAPPATITATETFGSGFGFAFGGADDTAVIRDHEFKATPAGGAPVATKVTLGDLTAEKGDLVVRIISEGYARLGQQYGYTWVYGSKFATNSPQILIKRIEEGSGTGELDIWVDSSSYSHMLSFVVAHG